jgi:uncharacterized protein (TIGR03790 family)
MQLFQIKDPQRIGIRIGILGAIVLGASSLLFGEPVQFEVVADEAERVVILANSADADSVKLAEYYADRRQIPRENIVTLDLPLGEEIDWQDFVIRLQDPLQNWLLERGWIDAIAMNLRDDAGRRKLSVSGHKISYLVTCRGVPLKIRQTEGIPKDGGGGSQAFKTHQAAVDSELTLIATNETTRDGFVRNPKFMTLRPKAWEPETVVRVARLDGPTYSVIRRMVDSAIFVEQQGLIGRAVIDIGGPHAKGDVWFGETADEFLKAGWPTSVDRARPSLPATARVDSVAWYLGWYESNINGPFALPGFEFAPGAVVLHLHSFSARTLRTADGGGWSGPLVARGAAATVGNVYEPYLEYTHLPQMLARALLGGATLGEAAFYAMPVLSWQSIVLGDPLYRPMKVTLAQQWERRAELPVRGASYVALHRMVEARSAPDAESEPILALGAKAMREYPSLGLALEIANLREKMGDRAGAIRELGIAVYLTRLKTEDWGLMAEVAQTLTKWEDAATAVKVWQSLFKQTLPDKLRAVWLTEATATAKIALQFDQMIEWEREISRLKGN